MSWIFFGVLFFAFAWGIRKFVKIESKSAIGFVHLTTYIVNIGAVAMIGYGIFTGMFFYAEPGFKYHVRTITGTESMVETVGYNNYLFGRVNAWKNAMSVSATNRTISGADNVNAEGEGTGGVVSANLGPLTLVFLDQVDSQVTATARFSLPADEESFLRMARQFRTPENLLRTELIPAFQETLGATASLMAAEEYFSGGRTEFNLEFQIQMQNGVYIVRRREKVVDVSRSNKGTANASLEDDQKDFGDNKRTIFVVEKVLDSNGQPRRKSQNFAKFGITAISARVTNVNPNERFQSRMQQKQDAAAARSVAREQRIQEEEQRWLVIAKGDREVAESQAKSKVIQIKRTTEAETEKQLAITAANKLRDSAKIDKERSVILLAKAKIDADAVRVTAEAEAYKKRVVLEADNALTAKLKTEVEVQKVWAAAYAKRNVPQYVFGTGSNVGASNTAPTGSDSEARILQQILTLEFAKRLDYQRDIKTSVNSE